jgi:hypothetical protein
MSSLVKVIEQLRSERDQAQKRIEQLDEALRALAGLSGGAVRHNRRASPGKRGTLSAAARRRIAAAQRARWAKWKAAKRA